MRKLTSLIAFTVALIGSIAVQAQVYPVQGNGVLIPPYSVYLADYTEGTSDRIVLNVVLNDVSRPDLRVRLRAKIIGQSVTLETKPEYIGRELVLEGGIPLRLTGIDLAEYFDPVNLNFSGISRREFEKTGALPQGLYQFCFEVLEYNRGVKISNTICANGWLILNDPPIINLPRNGEKLVPTQPQNIVFQWTPRHTGSPNSAFTTEYDVKLVELWPANRNPNDAILTSPPILEETTRSTAFIYDVSQTPLELGRHYALQVKAKSIAGADELDLFKNNGKSEVATFIYGDPCTVPQNILLEATSATRFTARWAGDFNHTGYSLRYRLADNPSAPWYTNTTLVPDAAISGLQPNTTYEVQIAGGCGVFESLYSGTARIKTFTSEQGYSCGMPLEQFNLDPVNLLDVLKVGDVIQAGDFDVKIAKVSGSNGTFTGEGVIEVPFFNKARVKAEFASIVVNKDMRMVNGYLNVTGAGVDIVPSGVLNMMDELIGAADSALTNLENNRQQPFDPNAFVPDTTLTLPGPVTVTDDNGTVVVTDANGVQHRLPPGTEAAIVDDQGNGTLIDSKGNAHAVSGAVATAAANREYNLALKFTEAKNNPTYGFDALDELDAEVFKILANRYTKLEDNYYVPYKSVETGHTTTITGELEGSGIDKSRIRFQLGGVTVPSTPFSGNESTVTVSGKADGEEEWLIAVLPAENGTGKDQVLGRVNVVSYNKINKNVVIIPVNGNTFSESEGTALQTELNKIYHQAVVSWSVSVRSGIQVAGIDPFDVGATGMLTNYTRHMKDVINAYKDNMKDGEDTYYLFLVKNPTDPEIDGVMPRSKNYGFIFMDKSENSTLEKMARTMAHELGHGAFNLHHTFMEENYSLRKGETDNLMDYAGGKKSYKYQWDMVRNPPFVVGMMESDEEGASMGLPCLGIFDDCDDVLVMLKAIKHRVENNRILPVFKPNEEKNRKSEYIALAIEVADNDYNKILIKNDIKDDGSLNPRRYYDYFETQDDKMLFGFIFKMSDSSAFKVIITDERDSIATRTKMEKLRVYLFGSIKPIGDETIENEPEDEELFLDDVTWVSQFDESIFGLCSGCWQSKCCRRATEYILGNTSIANCTDTIIAKTAPYMEVLGKIVTGSFTDNSSDYTKDTYNSAVLNFNISEAEEAAKYLKKKLDDGRPVIIGVHYTNGTSTPPNNANRATRHFMVVVGSGVKDGKTYFRFYDPGRSTPNEAEATSESNKLVYNKDTGSIQGSYFNRTYSLTEVVKTN